MSFCSVSQYLKQMYYLLTNALGYLNYEKRRNSELTCVYLQKIKIL
ncbi:hypothetical protein FM107_19120 [Sphingobacterium sp. JB170]|nr:hypothetical protein FM107_19120 [Sphingobacterium sp. JB170]